MKYLESTKTVAHLFKDFVATTAARLGIVAMAFACGAFHFPLASADDVGPSIRPIWMSVASAGPVLNANTSYLYNTQVQPNTFQQDLFGGQKNIAGLQQRYDDRTRDYDMRHQAGIVDPYAEQTYTQSMTGFGSDTSHDLMHGVRSTQGGIVAANFRQANNQGDISTPVKATGAVTTIASGNPVSFNLDESTKVSTRTDLVHQNGEVDLNSTAMNCVLYMDNRNPTDPLQAAAINAERYRLSLWRPLNIFDLSSSLSYGATTNTVRAAVSRPIFDRVVGEFDSTRGSDASGIPTEQAVRVSYGLSF